MVEVTLCAPSLLGYDTKSIMKSLQEEVRWGGCNWRLVEGVLVGGGGEFSTDLNVQPSSLKAMNVQN
jgi:hypothetical protein